MTPLSRSLVFLCWQAHRKTSDEFSSCFSQLWELVWNYVYQCEKNVSFKIMIFWVVLLNDFVRWVWSIWKKWAFSFFRVNLLS